MSRIFALTLVAAGMFTNLVFPSMNSTAFAGSIDPNANGYNVVFASHPYGSFVQVGPGSWKETLNGQTGYFSEQGRDEWSVYLVKSNGVRVQIDLYRKKVVLTSSGTPRDLYTIQESKSVNGNTVARVNHAYGEFTQTAPGQWKEVLNGNVGYFREQGRDEWSVYLVKDNGVSIQLDLWTNKIFQLANGRQLELYAIQSASSR